MSTYFGTCVDSGAKSRFPKSVTLQSWHMRTSTLICLISRFSDCACKLARLTIKVPNPVPPESFKPTGVEQFVVGFPQTTRPHKRQWCLRLEKLNGSLMFCQYMRRRTGCDWTDKMGKNWRNRHLTMLLLFVPAIFVELVVLLKTSETRLGQSSVSVDLPSTKEAVYMSTNLETWHTLPSLLSSRFASKYVRSTIFCRIWTNAFVWFRTAPLLWALFLSSPYLYLHYRYILLWF